MMLTMTDAGGGAPAAGAGAGAGAGGSSRVVSLPPVPGTVVTVPSADGDDGIDAWLQLHIPSAQAIRKIEKATLVRMPHSRSKRDAALSYRKQMMQSRFDLPRE